MQELEEGELEGAMIGGEPLESWMRDVLGTLVDATRASNKLPAPQEYGQYATLGAFRDRMSELGGQVLDITQGVLGTARPESATALAGISASGNAEGVAEGYDDVFPDVFDSLLDTVDTYADEASGDRQAPRLVVTRSVVPARGVQIFSGKNVGRPQDSFEDRVDNFARGPWIPRITQKPNAKVPLEAIRASFEAAKKATASAPAITEEMETHIRTLGMAATAPGQPREIEFPHPYESELAHIEYAPWQLQPAPEVMFGDVEKTPCTWVDTPEQLAAVEKKLEAAREFAVDLEAHDLRSYAGFTCLMQLSTRTEDFLVDTLRLRSHMHILNQSFTDPRILKVLHGCDWDVLWLQRDFGVYLVNVFDTGQAARVLEKSSFGLKHLLQLYCNVEADKRFQLADWRIRPLLPEMFRYAREDTHFLLYIYDRMKSELLARAEAKPDLVLAVLNRSRDLCLKTYKPPPPPDPGVASRIVSQARAALSPVQVGILCELVKWRDDLARQEDESTRFVMPNSTMIRVAVEIPKTIPALLNCCSPIPPLVRTHAADILDIVKKADVSVPRTVSPFTAMREAKKTTPVHTRFGEDGAPEATVPETPVVAAAAAAAAPTSSTSTTTPISPARTTSPSIRPPPAVATATTTTATTAVAMAMAMATAHVGSPVLSTEQLYKAAGWEGSEMEEVALDSPVVSRASAAAMKARATRTTDASAASRGSMFGGRSEVATTTMMMMTTTTTTGEGGSEEEEEEGEEEEEEEEEERKEKQAAKLIVDSMTFPPLGSVPVPVPAPVAPAPAPTVAPVQERGKGKRKKVVLWERKDWMHRKLLIYGRIFSFKQISF